MPSHSESTPTTLAQVYRSVAERYADAPAFVPRGPQGYGDPITFSQLYQRGLDLATGLRELGVERRTHVALIADNRLEWMLCDYGVLLAGAADVPRGTDITDQELSYILNHSDSVVTILENDKLYARYEKVRPDLIRKTPVILIETRLSELPEDVYSLQEVEQHGRTLRTGGQKAIEDGIEAIEPRDLFTLIYTSGTTGTPKGVQLTHANMISQINNVDLDFGLGDRALSILPIWHSYERVVEMIGIAGGACTYYTSLRTIGDDLKTVRPTIMGSAPRLWEGLHAKILKNIQQASPVKQTLFRWAYGCSRLYQGSLYFLKDRVLDPEGRAGTSVALKKLGHALRLGAVALPFFVLDALVLKNIRAVIGGSFKGTISGGGALPPHIDEFFNYIGIPVWEGYGMTETSPVTAVRTPETLIIGTVGKMVKETHVRIVDLNDGSILYPDAEDQNGGRGKSGEIHIKGPQVMRGYYKDVVQTEKVLKDGWMNTGDIGMITFNECLKIIGRSKDTIVLLSGENIEPLPIESKILESPLIDQCMAIGQDQKQLGALVVPATAELANRLGIDSSDLSALIEDPRAQKIVHDEIRMHVNISNGFRSWEQIHHVALIAEPFQVGHEMTQTFKLKRHIIGEKHQAEIDRAFG